jgi:hypothetical protein
MIGKTRQDVDRRAIGQHIGAALRHARAACELNLKRAPLDSVRRKAGHAIDCLWFAGAHDEELDE